MWVVVKIMVPFWVPNIIRHPIFRMSKRNPNFDNYPCGYMNPKYRGFFPSLERPGIRFLNVLGSGFHG